MAKAGSSNLAKWAAIIIGLIMAVTGWVYSLGVQGEQLKTNCKADDIYHPQVPILDTRVTRVEENVKSINQNMAEQKNLQNKILDKQDEILRELRP